MNRSVKEMRGAAVRGLAWGWIAAALVACGAASGQEPPGATTTIEERIKKLSIDPATGEDALKALDVYKEALALSEEAKRAAAATEEFEKKTAVAPAALEQLAARNSQALAEPETPPAVDGSLDELTRQLEIVKAELAEARAAAKSHAEEGKSRLSRQAALPGIIAKANADLAALPEPEAPPASAPELQRAEFERTQARRKLLEQQVRSYEAELRYSEASPALFSAESGTLARRVARLEKSAELLQARVDALRQVAASDEVERARRDLEAVAGDPEAEALAAEVLELAQRHGGKDGLSKRMARAAAELSRLEAVKDRVSKQFSSAKRRVKLLENVGLSIDAATGRLLRSQRQMLPSRAALREQLQQVVANSAQAQIDLIVLEDRHAELLASPLPEGGKDPELERLSKARLEGLRTLIEDYRSYIKALSSTTTLIRSLIDESSAFALFVDQRLLWIPSTEPIGVDELALEAAAVSDLFARRPFAPIAEDITSNPWWWVLAGCLVSYLVIRRRKFRERLVECSEVASKRNCTSFTPTAKAFVLTLLIAAPVPLAMWFVYSRAQQCPAGVVHGIRNVAGFLTSSILLHLLAHPQGLMVNHFRMAKERCKLLRKAFGWFIPTVPVFLFFAVAMPLESVASSAGRLSFIALVGVFLVLLLQLLKPSKGLIHWRGKPANRFAKTCYLIGIVIPASLILGAMIGYYDSVQEIRIQALMSVGLILATLFVAAMLYRWILVSRRRFAVEQALKRRAAMLAEKEEPEPGTKPQNVASLEEVKANAVKVVEVEEQTSRLVRAAAIAVVAFGIWGIWMPAIPALSALDRVTLWRESAPEAKGEPAAASSAVTKPLEAIAPKAESASADVDDPGVVSLQDLITSFIVLVLTFVAARNIPGLLELMFFRHMDLKPGSSFAFTTTIRYLIVVCGIVIAFAKIGITWGKVQWIAAAITLGVGFGLQEIFANFVAGLIILFERPIRLGDIVTIAGVDGKVTQIQIRATTIRQFNSRELIVPNKEFITGQLVNWTLSDSILRVDVPVGIAYGSDTQSAKNLMLRAARDNPRILDDPEPQVVFDNFADSSLAFILRAHVGSVEDMLPAKNELHFAIDDAFREAGIEIAFPQSDIRIVSLPEPKGGGKNAADAKDR